MSGNEHPPVAPPNLRQAQVFLSASIPVVGRWSRPFDPLEITEAALAVVRGVLAAGGSILYGGHPAIAPLILRVAAAFQEQKRFDNPRVTVYQSELYRDRIPSDTWALVAEGMGTIEIVDAMPGESPEFGKNKGSLEAMRDAMLDPQRNTPVGAVFVGGMEGILDEYRLFRERFPEVPTYPIGGAGGMAADLAERPDLAESSVPRQEMAGSRDYGSLMDIILLDILQRQ